MPAAEVDITPALVRGLLEDQAPDFARFELVPLANGWDNVLFRLGSDHIVRLPRRRLSAGLIRTEQRWLPEIAPHVPLPIPSPVLAGAPGRGYPWSWSVVPWLPGDSALHTPPRDLDAAAVTLAAFINALHALPVPADPPVNEVRGVPLRARDAVTRQAIHDSVVLARWDEALDLPPFTGPPVWLHGDLHPGNLLVHRGRLSGVIDFGDLTAGDPATDLFAAWALFPPPVRDTFRAALRDVDDATWARGKAWALALGAVVMANSADNPAYHRLGQRMVAAVLDEG
jgi:aminoglycoside phosphotransferase (APT) family kinase protein